MYKQKNFLYINKRYGIHSFYFPIFKNQHNLENYHNYSIKWELIFIEWLKLNRKYSISKINRYHVYEINIKKIRKTQLKEKFPSTSIFFLFLFIFWKFFLKIISVQHKRKKHFFLCLQKEKKILKHLKKYN